METTTGPLLRITVYGAVKPDGGVRADISQIDVNGKALRGITPEQVNRMVGVLAKMWVEKAEAGEYIDLTGMAGV